MRTRQLLATVLIAACAQAVGCVERRFVIESDPPGALVFINGKAIGSTPVDAPYLYYGTYEFKLVKDGYEPLTIQQEVVAPWYAYPPIDFAAENLLPLKLDQVKRFRYALQPMRQPQINELRNQAENLRIRGRQLPPPKRPSPDGSSNGPPFTPTPNAPFTPPPAAPASPMPPPSPYGSPYAAPGTAPPR